ncbi:hypothetical protein [Hymenobacter koreensis]|uniref:Alpha/beta hydrolase n=1 Tax=Hymenobacter koreensis TaxID=1084523 RepID=A0ABP8JDK8_9BACT
MPESLAFVGLHYWAGSGRANEAMTKLLAPDHDLLATDLAGFGDAPPRDDCSVTAYADQVCRFY